MTINTTIIATISTAVVQHKGRSLLSLRVFIGLEKCAIADATIQSYFTFTMENNKFKSEIRILNMIIIVENVMGVYRNYCTLGLLCRIFVSAQVLITAIVHIASFCYYTNFIYNSVYNKNSMLFVYIVTINFLTTNVILLHFFLGIQRSASFQGIILKIDRVHNLCKDSSTYSRGLQKLTSCALVNSTCCVTICIAIVAGVIYNFLEFYFVYDGFTYIVVVAQIALMVWRGAQFYIEKYIFEFIINLMTLQLKEINLTIESATAMFDKEVINHSVDAGQCLIEENIRALVPAFDSLAICSIKVKHCFGIQVSTYFKVSQIKRI